jgi:hypothetical protein
MKPLMLLAVAMMSIHAYASECVLTMQQARAKVPELAGLDDQSAIRVLHSIYYPSIPINELAAKMCVQLDPPKSPKTLGRIDRWRYESCQQDAAKAPTPQGVNIGMRLCREKFEQ